MIRLCCESPCGKPATYRGRCQRHQRQRNRETHRNREVYNSKRWKILRRHKLALNSICERCREAIATDVHHRHGVENDPWSLAGLESLCHSCHSKETRRGLEVTG